MARTLPGSDYSLTKTQRKLRNEVRKIAKITRMDYEVITRGEEKFHSTKLKLTMHSYELTLRTLRTYLTLIEGNVAELLQLIDKALRGHQPFSKYSNEEIRDASNATMVRLTEFAIFGMLKRLSIAVGVADLKETYDQVRELAGEDNIPARLIDLSIRLDHFGHIPEADVRELEKLLRSNITAYTILRLLVADFLHLFPCDYKTEQKMVQLFKFQAHIPKLAEKRIKRLKS